jgi:hypothetical protein
LFDTSKQNISYHFLNIFNDRELNKEATVKEILTVQQEGAREVKRSHEQHNLDANILHQNLQANFSSSLTGN